MQTIINPLVVSVGPTNEATITPVPMTAHGGGAKKVLAVVAAVAIPIAAPAIASSIAASGVLGAAVSGAMATTAGAVVSSAIVGAGLGAISAKVTGGNVKAGAISGLIGGAIGGYGSASKGLFGTPQGGVQGTVNRTFGTSFGQATPTNNVINQGDASILSNQSTDGQFMQASYSDPNIGNAIVKDAAGNLSNEASGSFLESMKKGVGAATEKIADRLTNPDVLANAVLQVGGAVAAEAIVGTPGMTPDEQAALETYKAELETLKQRDEAAFNAKMDAAKQYMVQAGYYDPQYFGLQSANRAAIAEGRKLREFERKAGLRTGGVSAGDRRRAALSGGANIQSAYDRGFMQGINLQNQAMSTGVGLIPGAPTGGVTQAAGLADAAFKMGNVERAAADAKKSNIQNFFGQFSTQSGLTKDEQEERRKKSGGLDTGNMPNLDQKKDTPKTIMV